MLVGIVGEEGWLIDVDGKVGECLSMEWVWHNLSAFPEGVRKIWFVEICLFSPHNHHVSLLRAGAVVITYSGKIVSPAPISAWFLLYMFQQWLCWLPKPRERGWGKVHLLSLQFCLFSSGNFLHPCDHSPRAWCYIGRSEDLESNTYKLINSHYIIK